MIADFILMGESEKKRRAPYKIIGKCPLFFRVKRVNRAPRWMMEKKFMNDKEERIDKLSTLLSVWGGSLGTIALVLFFMKSQGKISNENCQFGVGLSLTLIALSAGVFSIYTKRAPYRGGIADKDENPVEYYVMTTIWILVSSP